MILPKTKNRKVQKESRSAEVAIVLIYLKWFYLFAFDVAVVAVVDNEHAGLSTTINSNENQ